MTPTKTRSGLKWRASSCEQSELSYSVPNKGSAIALVENLVKHLDHSYCNLPTTEHGMW
jgi:hypothetical protein